VGIATESDIFRSYIALLGAREELARITLRDVDLGKGVLREITGVVEESGAQMVSIFSLPQRASDLRMVVIRARGQDQGSLERALKAKGFVIHR
jgi:hypothetical protein